MQKKFAKYLGNNNFRPVFIDYRNMEELLNVKSLGNLNRMVTLILTLALIRTLILTPNPISNSNPNSIPKFVSLLRSEQDSGSAKIKFSLLFILFYYYRFYRYHHSNLLVLGKVPVLGNPTCWENMLEGDVKMITLDEAFDPAIVRGRLIYFFSFLFVSVFFFFFPPSFFFLFYLLLLSLLSFYLLFVHSFIPFICTWSSMNPYMHTKRGWDQIVKQKKDFPLRICGQASYGES